MFVLTCLKLFYLYITQVKYISMSSCVQLCPHFLLKMWYLAAILDFGGHLRLFMSINNDCLKLSIHIIFQFSFVLFWYKETATFFSNKTMNDCSNLGCWRPFWILKSCISEFYNSYFVYLFICFIVFSESALLTLCLAHISFNLSWNFDFVFLRFVTMVTNQ